MDSLDIIHAIDRRRCGGRGRHRPLTGWLGRLPRSRQRGDPPPDLLRHQPRRAPSPPSSPRQQRRRDHRGGEAGLGVTPPPPPPPVLLLFPPPVAAAAAAPPLSPTPPQQRLYHLCYLLCFGTPRGGRGRPAPPPLPVSARLEGVGARSARPGPERRSGVVAVCTPMGDWQRVGWGRQPSTDGTGGCRRRGGGRSPPPIPLRPLSDDTDAHRRWTTSRRRPPAAARIPSPPHSCGTAEAGGRRVGLSARPLAGARRGRGGGGGGGEGEGGEVIGGW